MRDPPRTALSRTGSRSPERSSHPPQPPRGVPRVRDPEVVEGPTRPICPPSDPASCLSHPRGVVPAPLPYQDITHRTHIGLAPHSEPPGDSRLPSVHVGAFLGLARPTPRERRRHRLLRRAALCSRCTKFPARQVRGRFVVVSAGLRARSRSAGRLGFFFFSSLAASSSTSSPHAATAPSSRTRTRRGAMSRGGRLLPRSRPWQ